MNQRQIVSGKDVLRIINDLNIALGEAVQAGLVINITCEERPRFTPKTPIITAHVLAPISLEDET